LNRNKQARRLPRAQNSAEELDTSTSDVPCPKRRYGHTTGTEDVLKRKLGETTIVHDKE
jgi:hypothetical protein